MHSLARVAALWLLLALVAPLPRPSRASALRGRCPSQCAAQKGVNLTALAPQLTRVRLFKFTPSFCRRTCFARGGLNNKYYLYTASKACYCFRNCPRAIPPGQDVVTWGQGPTCRDFLCPVSCETAVDSPFIAAPEATATIEIPNLADRNYTGAPCRQFCQDKGSYYGQLVSGTCSCYRGCNSALAYWGSNTPSRLGYIPAC